MSAIVKTKQEATLIVATENRIGLRLSRMVGGLALGLYVMVEVTMGVVAVQFKAVVAVVIVTIDKEGAI